MLQMIREEHQAKQKSNLPHTPPPSCMKMNPMSTKTQCVELF